MITRRKRRTEKPELKRKLRIRKSETSASKYPRLI